MNGKTLLLIAILFLTVVNVKSGIILDGIKHTVKGVKQEIHKLGETFFKFKQSHSKGHHDSDDNISQSTTTQEYTKTFTTEKTSSVPLIDVRSGSEHVDTTFSPIRNTTEFRRLIKVGVNCPDGFQTDSAGICREEY